MKSGTQQHYIITADAHAILRSMKILNETSMFDCVPFVMILDVDSLPETIYEVNSACKAKLDWAKLTNEDVLSYCGKTDVLLSDVYLPKGAIMCSGVYCNEISYHEARCAMCDGTVGAAYEASRSNLL